MESPRLVAALVVQSRLEVQGQVSSGALLL